MTTPETIAIFHEPFTFVMGETSSGARPTVSFFGDQSSGEFKTNPTRRRGSIVARDGESMPDLLRTVAGYMEQEGIATLAEVAESLVKGRE